MAYPAGDGWAFEVRSVEEFWILASEVAARVVAAKPLRLEDPVVALAAGDGAAALAMLEHVVREARAGRWGAAVELVSQSNATTEEGGARVG